MTDDIDRVLRVRVIADGLPITPRKNPWKCRAASGLAISLAFGADGSVDYGGVPAEWAGVTPYLDWDPENASAVSGFGTDLATLPDSSGNGRNAAPALTGAYPFVDLPYPKLITSPVFSSKPTLDFRINPNVDPYSPGILMPTMPAGPFSLALVCYSDMPDHDLMPGGGGVGPPIFTNNYAVSSQGDAIGVYADGQSLRGFRAWGDPGFAEPGGSADFATTPTVLLLTSSGESAPAAGDAVVKWYTRTLTPLSASGRAPITAVPWLLGSYPGGAIYSLQGEVARVIVWDVELTEGVQATAALNALGLKYGITIVP